MRKNNKLSFDVMLDGRFIKTYELPSSAFAISEKKLRKFVEQKLPSLKGKDYKIEFNS